MKNCRFCGERTEQFLDLGMHPLSNAFLSSPSEFDSEEKFPLTVCHCCKCGLVQSGYDVNPVKIFTDNYVYFSGTSEETHNHAKWLAKRFHDKFNLSGKFLIEMASNDGTVLKHFKEFSNENYLALDVLGIEPTENTATYAIRKNSVDTVITFFDSKIKEKLDAYCNFLHRFIGLPANGSEPADFILARHVFAHIPDIHSVMIGLCDILKEDGVIAIENPYMAYTINQTKFQTIYHEHYSYLSVLPMMKLFNEYGMEIFDIDEVKIQGGSLIYYIGWKGKHTVSPSIDGYIKYEENLGLNNIDIFLNFAQRVETSKKELLDFLFSIKNNGNRIAVYGAPAKGNTELNYSNIDESLIDFAVDKNCAKIGKFMPGSHIPIYGVDKLEQDMPEYTLVLAWNLIDEIIKQQKLYLLKGGKFILTVPNIHIYELPK